MSTDTVVEIKGLKKWFKVRQSLVEALRGKTLYLKAVDSVDFKINRGEILGLAGESGCGKTTICRLLLRLIEPTDGQILFMGRDLVRVKGEKLRKLRREMQMIFQDPYSSLNPRMVVYHLLAEPLKVHKLAQNDSEKRIVETLVSVGLVPPQDFLRKYPHELSGGQRQRVAIARAIIAEPKLLVADEAVSMLDVSIRTSVLTILQKLKYKSGLSQLFITHDLSLARCVCDRIAIMYLGKIVEMGPSTEVIDNPLHPYTQALISAVPVPDPNVPLNPKQIKGEIPSAINPPKGCRFHPRCPIVKDLCRKTEPELLSDDGHHFVACHRA